VIDTQSNEVKHWIPLISAGYGGAPTPDGRWFLVALPDVNKVAMIDVGAMQVVRNIDVAAYPQAVVISPDGRTAYVSCMRANKVAVIDVSSGKTTRTIDTGSQTDGLAWAAR
jgi:YVTN family beta-propeller protein